MPSPDPKPYWVARLIDCHDVAEGDRDLDPFGVRGVNEMLQGVIKPHLDGLGLLHADPEGFRLCRLCEGEGGGQSGFDQGFAFRITP